MGQPNGPALAHQIAFVPRRQIKGWLSADVGVLFAIEFQDRRGAAWRRSEGPMTRQTFLQIVSSGFSNTADNESGVFPSSGPLDEEALAAEIDRILKCKMPAIKSSRSGSGATPPHWLGEEDDLAMIEAFSAAGEPSIDEPETEETLCADGDADSDVRNSDQPPVFDVAIAADWVRRARRQRWRGRLRNAGGWTLSIMVSLALVLIASLIIFRWLETADHPIQQKTVKAIDLTNIETMRDATMPNVLATAPIASASVSNPVVSIAAANNSVATERPHFVDANLAPFGR